MLAANPMATSHADATLLFGVALLAPSSSVFSATAAWVGLGEINEEVDSVGNGVSGGKVAGSDTIVGMAVGNEVFTGTDTMEGDDVTGDKVTGLSDVGAEIVGTSASFTSASSNVSFKQRLATASRIVLVQSISAAGSPSGQINYQEWS